jgi:hypothetical protein
VLWAERVFDLGAGVERNFFGVLCRRLRAGQHEIKYFNRKRVILRGSNEKSNFEWVTVGCGG